MNRNDIQKYFDRRPNANELYTVGGIVFINCDDAANYAKEMGLVMETFKKEEGSPKTGDGKPEEKTKDQETGDVKTELKPVPVEKKKRKLKKAAK